MWAVRLLLGLAVAFSLSGGPSWADDAALPRIGWVSAVAGAVQYHSGGGQWSDALVNEPIAAGAGLRSAPDAVAELRLAGGRIALAGGGELQILRFDADVLEIAVPAGRVGIHLDAVGPAKTVEIDLPSGAAWLAASGDYDIAAGDAQTGDGRAPPRVEIFAGKAQLGDGLEEGQLAASSPDPFSDWWRSQGDDGAPSTHRLAPDIAGAAALDANGRWENDPQFGAAWFPSDIAADWAPYRTGVWRFLPPWGWTWIDDAAWGFAPSHYGRWARIGDRWGWVPDPQTAPADYSPAAIALLGTAGIGLSRPGDNGAAVVWFPLAPGEAVGDGNEPDYRNRRFASAVPRAVFVGGQPVAAALLDLPEQRLLDAPVILGSLDIPPAGPPAVAAARKPVLVVVAAAPPRVPPRKPETRVALLARPHPAPSTSPPHSAHNRQHLAAARGAATGSWRVAR